MTITLRPDLASLEVPMDSWTAPFWDATAKGELRLPRCAECGTFRWPPGPFCRSCRSQQVDWAEAGQGQIYSFTLLPAGPDRTGLIAPALIEYPDAGGVRLAGAIVETSTEAIRIGAPVRLDFSQARNAMMPVFRVDAP